MATLRNLWNNRHALRSIIHSIFFCFHYLPFKQAVRLPILLYKPKLLKIKGKVVIQGEVRFGIIRLGFPTVSLFPNSGIVFENRGSIIFNGSCYIGNNSAISVGEKGQLEFGNRFCASTSLKLTCYDKIVFGNRVLLGWNVLVLDTDFHKLTKLSGKGYSRGHAPVTIGSDNWLGNNCIIMKRSATPNYCVIQAGTILSEAIKCPEYCVIGTDRNIIVKATGLWRNFDDDFITY